MKSKNEEIFYKQVGRLIATARKHAGMKQEALASELNMSRYSIANIEAGRQKPSVYIIVQISQMININYSNLIPKFADSYKMDVNSAKQLQKGIGKGKISKKKFEEFYITSKNLIRNEI